MKLKKIYIYGFKSFATKTEIEVQDGITTIIGPNGSGKSNIVEAIRWVLGEQSAKSLRAQKSQDIIFNGTQFRKSLGYAEVSIVFDNSDNSIPIEYDEVKVTRKLYRDGESGYYINGNSVRLKTIQEIFMDTGIGKDGYSIIGQGRIDEILSNNSEERRKVFEEATGIVKFRERKKDSLKNIANTEENLLRINDIIFEIGDGLDVLKEKSERAEKYIEICKKKKAIDLRIFKENLEIIKEKELQNTEELNQILNKKEELNQIIQNLKEKKAKISKHIEDFQTETEERYNQISSIKEELSNIRNKIKGNIEKVEIYSNKSLELQEEQQELELKILNIILELETKNKKISNYVEGKKEFEERLLELEKQLEEQKNVSSQKEQEISKILSNIEEVKEKIYEYEKEINLKAIEQEKSVSKYKYIEQEKKDLLRKIDSLGFEIKEQEEKFSTENKELIEKINIGEKEAGKFKEKQNKYDELKLEIEKLKHSLILKKQNINILKQLEREKEGFSYAVKKIISKKDMDRELAQKVIGSVVDVIEVDSKYVTAIESALGYSMQNILVKNATDAKHLINMLKRNKYGKATFLPLEKFENLTISNNREVEEIISSNKIKEIDLESKLAIDVLKCDKKYQNIFKELLKNTIIVSDIDKAILLSKKLNKAKIVTLDGEIFSATGSITGGYSKKVSNIIGRKKEIEELEQNTIMLEKEIIEKEKVFKEIENQIKEEEKTFKEVKEKLINEKLKLAIAEKDIDITKEKREELQKRKKEIEEMLQNLTQKIDEGKQELSIQENKKLEETEKLQRLEVNVEELEQKLKTDENVKIIEEIKEEITDIKISIASFDESIKGIEEIKEKIEKDKRDCEYEINKKKFGVEEQKDLIERLKVENEEKEKDIEKLIQTNEELNKLQEEYSLERKQEIAEQEELEQKLINLEKEVEKILESKLSTEQNIFKLNLERENIIENMWTNYEITPNNINLEEIMPILNELKLNTFDIEGNIIEFKYKEAKKYLSKYKQEISSLGVVEISAIEEYKNRKERYDALVEQQQDLEKSKKELQKVIRDISITMEEQFVSRLALINNNFKQVFKELFGGGKALIELENPEEPLTSGINIKVEPPGKKLQNMMLLSGGERAFTAIAILFSILNINPSPFCVLDEIEAALDDVNVQRVAKYLENYSKDTQFLVITHRKGTMEVANIIYGITMEENGISKLVSLDVR